jgi:hypothetical protein
MQLDISRATFDAAQHFSSVWHGAVRGAREPHLSFNRRQGCGCEHFHLMQLAAVNW